MDRFIGRKTELNRLEELYRKDGFCMAVVYGRRRVGKSTLLAEFVKDKRSVFYTATKVSHQRNLELFTEEALSVLAPSYHMVFPHLEDLLSFIGSHAEAGHGKLVLVIDELPFWADREESILSTFQKFADRDWKGRNILLILCGSSLSFMEDKILSEKSPLFGRRDLQIRLDAFRYMEAAEFVPRFSNEDKAICYGLTGGVAKYLSLFDDRQSLDENIVRLFFDVSGYLYDEPRNLLTQEFSDISVVNAVIEQIASGENTLNLIADKTHEKEPAVLYHIKKLAAVGLVGRLSCITEESNKKKTRYVLKDSMFRFWYLFLPAAVSSIEQGKGQRYYEQVVKGRLHAFMGSVFEEMCRDYVLHEGLEGRLGCFVTQTGTWWGTEMLEDDSGKKRPVPADIDLVGLSPSDHAMVTGECKFRNEKIDRSVCETLVRRSRNLSGRYPVVQYLLFSLSGFTEYYQTEEAARLPLKLYTLDDLYAAGLS